MIFERRQQRKQKKLERIFRYFNDNLEYVNENSKIKDTADFIQHGSTTRYLHSVAVAYYSFRLAHILKMDNSLGELIRASLVHDYFLYNSKTADPANKGHVLNHPKAALERAEKDFQLTERERDIIESHMFPISKTMPKHKEAYIVALIDKLCAIYEFFNRKNPYPVVNYLFAKDEASGKRASLKLRSDP